MYENVKLQDPKNIIHDISEDLKENIFNVSDIAPIMVHKRFPDHLDKPWLEIHNMDEDVFYNYCENLRNYLKDNYIISSKQTYESIIDKLKKFSQREVLDEGDVYYENDGYAVFGGNKWGNVINNWFPERYKTVIIRGNSRKQIDDIVTVQNQFDDKNKEFFHRKMLQKVKNDAMYYYGNKKVDGKLITTQKSEDPKTTLTAGLSQIMNIGMGLQLAANFPPIISKWIYTYYLSEFDEDELNVYDPCMGWGGRIAGLIGTQTHKRYINKKIRLIGTDVNTDTHDRFRMFVSFWKRYVHTTENFNFSKYTVPQENMNTVGEFNKMSGTGHLVFTSPPYFNRELYSRDDNQSSIKFSQYNSWSDGFLKPMIKNAYNFLKVGGYLMMNVSNIYEGRKVYTIQDDTIEICNSLGMELVRIHNMVQTTMTGNNYNLKKEINENQKKKMKQGNIVTFKGKYAKSEPIYVFRKK